MGYLPPVIDTVKELPMTGLFAMALIFLVINLAKNVFNTSNIICDNNTSKHSIRREQTYDDSMTTELHDKKVVT